MKIAIYKTKTADGWRWYWQLIGRNGGVIANSAASYSERHNCQRAVRRFLALLAQDIEIALED